MRIMVVDDSITMRRIIINYLKSAGYYDIVEAGNGVEALSRMNAVNLVLTEWNMPVMDGISLVKEIRANPIFGSVPIIMITAAGVETEVLQALKEGVNDYIIKPFSKNTLIEKVLEHAAR